MAIFLRGDVWWFEYRTRKERVVRSTGFRKKDKAKAQAVLDAFRLARGQRPRRSVVEGILEAIYSRQEQDEGLPLLALWGVYEEWMKGKGRVVAPKTLVERQGHVRRVVEWAEKRGCRLVGDIDVPAARAFVAHLRNAGRSNKTLRNTADTLAHVWGAVGQLVGGLHNPWRAASPDNDGSSVRLEAFSEAEEKRVLAAAKNVGHGWWLASMVSRWTGLRYGDVAQLEWGDAEQARKAQSLLHGVVDLKARVIAIDPSKTRRHGVRVLLPIAQPLATALGKEKAREGFLLPEHGISYPAPFEPPFADVLAAAGLKGSFTFHSWRHTFRTRLAEAGVSDEVARRLGGWTNLGMAAHYDHASHLDEMREAVSKMAKS